MNQYFNITSTEIESSGIAYRRPIPPGNNTSYRTGDSGWHRSNGSYDYIAPTNPTHIATLDTSVNNMITLKDNNVFGNKNRFTDPVGGQDMSTYNYTIDHLTGLGYCYTRLTGMNWDEVIDHAFTATTSGYNDWRITNYHEASELWTPNQRSIGFYIATDVAGTGFSWGTSCTRAGLSTYNQIIVYTSGGGSNPKTATGWNYAMVRNHYN